MEGPHALLSCDVRTLSSLLRDEEMLISFLNTFLALPLFPRRLRYSASLGTCATDGKRRDVCVCVWKREREGERDVRGKKDCFLSLSLSLSLFHTQSLSLCLSVCVCMFPPLSLFLVSSVKSVDRRIEPLSLSLSLSLSPSPSLPPSLSIRHTHTQTTPLSLLICMSCIFFNFKRYACG